MTNVKLPLNPFIVTVVLKERPLGVIVITALEVPPLAHEYVCIATIRAVISERQSIREFRGTIQPGVT